MTDSPTDDFAIGWMAKQLKGGYLLRHKKRLFGKDWREEWVVLYDDSTLAWFKERGKTQPEGGLILKHCPELMAVGQYTLRVPGRPEMPSGCHIRQVMAFGARRRDKTIVHWFLCKSEDEVNDWMTAISNTLPPPPQPPVKVLSEQKLSTRPPNDPRPTAPPDDYYVTIPGQVPSLPPNGFHPSPGGMASSAHMGCSACPPPPQQHLNGYNIGGRAPLMNGTNTVIIRDRDRDPRACGGSGVGDIATGMLMGATLSNWGRGWGGGWGWGYGPGWGAWGGMGAPGGVGISNTDVNIFNHYDVDNTIHNDVDLLPNNTASFGDVPSSMDADVIGGYDEGIDSAFDMDFGGDFGF